MKLAVYYTWKLIKNTLSCFICQVFQVGKVVTMWHCDSYKAHGDATIAASAADDDDAALARRFAEEDGLDIDMLRNLELTFSSSGPLDGISIEVILIFWHVITYTSFVY